MGESGLCRILLHVVISLILVDYAVLAIPVSPSPNSATVSLHTNLSSHENMDTSKIVNQTTKSTQERNKLVLPRKRIRRNVNSTESFEPSNAILSRQKHHHLEHRQNSSLMPSGNMDYTIDLLPQPELAAAAQITVEAQILPWFLREGPSGKGGCIDRKVAKEAVEAALKVHRPPAGVSLLVHLPPEGKKLTIPIVPQEIFITI